MLTPPNPKFFTAIARIIGAMGISLFLLIQASQPAHAIGSDRIQDPFPTDSCTNSQLLELAEQFGMDTSSIACVSSTGLGYIPPAHHIEPTKDLTPYADCPQPHPFYVDDAVTINRAQAKLTELSGFAPNEVVEISIYTPSRAPTALYKSTTNHIVTDGNGNASLPLWLQGDSATGRHSIVACGGSRCTRTVFNVVQPESADIFGRTYRVPQGSPRLRTAPGSQYPVFGFLSQSTTVTVLDYDTRPGSDNSEWLYVREDQGLQRTGFVSSALFSDQLFTGIYKDVNEILSDGLATDCVPCEGEDDDDGDGLCPVGCGEPLPDGSVNPCISIVDPDN